MVKRTKPKVFNGLSCVHSRKFRIFLFFLIGSLLPSVAVMGQQTKQKTISIDFKDFTVIHALHEINVLSGDMVVFREEIVSKETKRVTLNRDNITVLEAVKACLEGTNLTCEQQANGKILVAEKQVKEVKLITVSGKVVDEKGNPIPGATVIIHGTNQGVATNDKGEYQLSAKPDDVLRISFIGYKTETTPIEGKSKIDIRLMPTSENIEEVTVVAFGEQKKESVVSAITTVRAADLKSSNSDLTASFAGKIAGMIGWQTGGIPGALTEEEMNTKFYIRGITSFQSGANIDPLILLDGVESSKLDLARINPDDIESFSVMKDASATAMYGARGANGVILVTTKKGEEGSVYTSASYEVITSMPTRKIEVVDPVTYMKAYNEALVTRDPLATPKYTSVDIARRGDKRFPSWVYPANDWYKVLFKNAIVNHHMSLSIRGGSKLVQYYASINHNRDAGMLKTDRLNQFDVNIRNNSTTFRVNLTINLSAGIQLLMNSYTAIDKYHGPLYDVTEAYQLVFNANPVDFAPTYPADKNYDWPHIRFGGQDVSANPYALIQMGYKDRSRYSTTNKVEYIHNLSSLIKGLELRASVSYANSGYYSNPYTTTPYVYTLKSYREDTNEHELTAWNPTEGSRILSLENSSKEVSAATQLTGEIRLMHTAAWKDHTTSYTAVFQAQEYSDSSPTTVQDGIPNRNLSLSMRMAYGYKNRYFLEGSFGYNGSERFAKHNRMGFFPAIGGAWVVSSENFMQGAYNWLPFLKFRLSYGKVGNDGVISSPRFVYIQNVTSYANSNSPVPGQTSSTGYHINAYENPDITWEIAEQVNLGMEAKIFKNGLLDVTLDAYQEIRHNILSNRVVIPAALGLGYYPMANIGKVRSRGIDFAGKIQHAFTPDLWVILNGTLTYNKATYLEIEQADDKPVWQDKIGHDISQAIGYIAEGLFRDEDEINNAPEQGGDVMPGDIRYRDLNGDNVIDVEDATYIGFPETPRLIYGFNGFINYKGFEFNFAFQGSGQRSLFMDPSALSPFYNNHALLKGIYEDHWSTDNMVDHPLWPRLSTKNLIEHNPQEDRTSDTETTRKSTYFMREVKFLRCTALELGYNFPKKITDRLHVKNMKIFARTNNPFLISNFKLWDVELGSSGFNYPIQKTYSLGLNISF